MQDNGGRKNRSLLTSEVDGKTEMDMKKVVDWVSHGKLQSLLVDSAPKGQVRSLSLSLHPLTTQNSPEPVLRGAQDKLRAAYYARENGSYPATPSDNKYAGKMHVARCVLYPSIPGTWDANNMWELWLLEQ